jgi:hypothetical protein
MTDDIAQTWDQVDIPLTFESPAEGEPGWELVSSAETRAAVREMLKDHFPEGPAAAIESHKAYCEWDSANAIIFFKADKDRPQIADVGRRWRGFVTAWRNYAAKEQWMMDRFHARPELEGGLRFTRARAVQKSPWRERRTNARSRNDNAKDGER